MQTYTEPIVITPDDVFTATGVSVTMTAIMQSANVIESLTGVFLNAAERTTPISRNDAGWIRRAVIFQTVWADENPDHLTRANASSISQDGVSVSASDGLTFVLAPMAKRALQNCTWTNSGTLEVAPASTRVHDTDWITSDAHGGWRPM